MLYNGTRSLLLCVLLEVSYNKLIPYTFLNYLSKSDNSSKNNMAAATLGTAMRELLPYYIFGPPPVVGTLPRVRLGASPLRATPRAGGPIMFASATIAINPLRKTHSVCAQQVAHEIRELSIASIMTIWPGGITYSECPTSACGIA